jgi:hypothetical protein
MAQTGYTPIFLYSSSATGNTPSLTNGTSGSELGINITDGKLFYKDNANALQVIGWKVRPATAGGTGLTSYTAGDLLYADTSSTVNKLSDVATGNALISGGVGIAPSYGKIGLTTHITGTLGIANGGTNQTAFTSPASSIAGLTWFDGTSFQNDSTPADLGYNASTNTFYAKNVNFSGTVSLTSALPVTQGGTGLTSLAAGYIPYGNGTGAFNSSSNLTFDGTNLSIGGTISNGLQRRVQNLTDTLRSYLNEGTSAISGVTSGSATTLATVNVANSTNGGRVVFQVTVTNSDANQGYASACSVREILYTKYGGNVTINKSTELSNNFGSVNAGVISIVLATSATVSGGTIVLQGTPTSSGAVGSSNMALQAWTQVTSSGQECTITLA